MGYDKETLKNMSAIYKFIYENPGVHRNIVRKALLTKGKIASKGKFYKSVEGLIALENIVSDKDNLSINPEIVQVGILQKESNGFYVLLTNPKTRIMVNTSVAAGYKVGDMLDVIVNRGKQRSEVIVLGKNTKTVQNNNLSRQKDVDSTPPHGEKGLVLGRVIKISHDELIFIPNNKSIVTRQIPILNNKDEYSAFQDKICVMKLEDPESPILGGHIVKVRGDAGNPIHEYDAIAENYGAIMSWKDAEQEIANIPTVVDVNNLNLITEEQALTMQKGSVVDLRHLPFTTVDPATCKDMDDAIYSTIDSNGDVVCYTAVANVTKYVKLNSTIGQKYINGGFTIYAPNRAYNILPTKLSTGICSLNPNQDRLAFVVKTTLDAKTGAVKHSNIYDAIINSHQKYSYEQAQEIVNIAEELDVKEDILAKAINGEKLSLGEQVYLNYYAGQIIKKGFDLRKMIRFVANKEREIVFDRDMKDVVDIKPTPHLQYHEVIEAFMITANEATAKFAKDNDLPNIYRVHEKPNPKKLERANEFFDILGIEFDGDLSAQGTRALIELIKDTSNEEVINRFLIKMQSRAVYSNKLYGKSKEKDPEDWLGERISHYALQSPHYSHTTSPIRRVPDYITQYNILAKMHETKQLPQKLVDAIVEIANERQLEVDQAEKDFDDISSVIYCEKHIGETMRGRITKIRYASVEEGYEDDIVVIAKNEATGISVEIPLSQILGKRAQDCFISEQACAVYDARGNTLLTLCKPIDFIIEKADRKTMVIVGRTNRELISAARTRENEAKHASWEHGKTQYADRDKHKQKRHDRIEQNKAHHKVNDEDFGFGE